MIWKCSGASDKKRQDWFVHSFSSQRNPAGWSDSRSTKLDLNCVSYNSSILLNTECLLKPRKKKRKRKCALITENSGCKDYICCYICSTVWKMSFAPFLRQKEMKWIRTAWQHFRPSDIGRLAHTYTPSTHLAKTWEKNLHRDVRLS